MRVEVIEKVRRRMRRVWEAEGGGGGRQGDWGGRRAAGWAQLPSVPESHHLLCRTWSNLQAHTLGHRPGAPELT